MKPDRTITTPTTFITIGKNTYDAEKYGKLNIVEEVTADQLPGEEVPEEETAKKGKKKSNN
jgi:hypothetical protein